FLRGENRRDRSVVKGAAFFLSRYFHFRSLDRRCYLSHDNSPGRQRTSSVNQRKISMKNATMTKEDPLARYNCGPVKFSGGDNALYERHLTFDQVIPVSSATPRDKFEAVARSIRDVLSQRWLKTEQTYRERNAKRVYYLSLEFL